MSIEAGTLDDPERELFVLGFLRGRPLSAYFIERGFREHVPLYRGFKRGNLYSFVEKLANAGLLSREVTAAARGPRPTKAVYHLTEAGEARFRVVLRYVILDVQASEPAFETALVLLCQLKRCEARALLNERAVEIEKRELRLARLVGENRSRGAASHIWQSHTTHRLSSERRFLTDTLALLQDPKWHPDWGMEDGQIIN